MRLMWTGAGFNFCGYIPFDCLPEGVALRFRRTLFYYFSPVQNPVVSVQTARGELLLINLAARDFTFPTSWRRRVETALRGLQDPDTTLELLRLSFLPMVRDNLIQLLAVDHRRHEYGRGAFQVSRGNFGVSCQRGRIYISLPGPDNLSDLGWRELPSEVSSMPFLWGNLMSVANWSTGPVMVFARQLAGCFRRESENSSLEEEFFGRML